MKTRNNPQGTKLTPYETKEKALNLLEYRAHSRKELFDKLRRFNDDAECINGILDELEECGLLDDAMFAFQFAHDAKALKYWGNMRIKKELALRGIGDDTAEDAIWQAEKEEGLSEGDLLGELMERKYGSLVSEPKGLQKAVAALMRLGYGYGEIKDAVGKYRQETKDYLYD